MHHHRGALLFVPALELLLMGSQPLEQRRSRPCLLLHTMTGLFDLLFTWQLLVGFQPAQLQGQVAQLPHDGTVHAGAAMDVPHSVTQLQASDDVSELCHCSPPWHRCTPWLAWIPKHTPGGSVR